MASADLLAFLCRGINARYANLFFLFEVDLLLNAIANALSYFLTSDSFAFSTFWRPFPWLCPQMIKNKQSQSEHITFI